MSSHMRSRLTCLIPTYIIRHIEPLSLVRSQDSHGATGHRKIRMHSPTVDTINIMLLLLLLFIFKQVAYSACISGGQALDNFVYTSGCHLGVTKHTAQLGQENIRYPHSYSQGHFFTHPRPPLLFKSKTAFTCLLTYLHAHSLKNHLHCRLSKRIV